MQFVGSQSETLIRTTPVDSLHTGLHMRNPAETHPVLTDFAKVDEDLLLLIP